MLITDEKLVSIIIPAYNSSKFINKALDSIKNQTYTNWEAIVVDDCSSDNTQEIINNFVLKDNRFIYIRLNKRSGAAIARNNAIKISNGSYIAFLDSDDIWTIDKLFLQVSYMEKNNLLFTCTSYDKVSENGEKLNIIVNYKDKASYNDLLKNSPGNSTVVYNADKLGKFEIIDIKKRNDYVLWLQIIKRTDYLYSISTVLSSHRIVSKSLSSNKLSLLKYHWYIYRNIEKLSLLKSTYLLVYWIFVSVFKLR